MDIFVGKNRNMLKCPPISAPVAQKKPMVSPSGKTDDYHWLKADNWQDVMSNPSVLADDIRAYLDAENAYTDAVMAPTKDLQDTLFDEIRGRIKEDDISLPMPDGKYEYYSRYEVGGQYPISARRIKGTADEEILFHFDHMGKEYAYFGIGDISRSHSHRYMAYGLDTNGSEYYTIRFLDTHTGRDLDDTLCHTNGAVVWAKGDVYVFYVTLNENHRSDKVWRHKMGTPQSDDVLVYTETDAGFFMGVDLTESEKYICINTHDHITSAYHILESDTPLGAFRVFAPRVQGVEYDISHRENTFYIHTNADGATDFKIMMVSEEDISPENWQECIPHTNGVLISSISVSRDYMVRMEKQNAIPRIVVHDFKTGMDTSIAFDEDAYSLGLHDILEYDDCIMRFSYASPTTPAQTYDYNLETHTRILQKTQPIPSGHTPSDYTCKRIYAQADDGVQVPLTVVYKNTTVLDNTTPAVLYGYGSYGHATPASFSINIISLLDRGFVYAYAHIRGGMDCGYDWYTDGKLMQKRNTFTDFIACGHALIDNGYTGYGNITIRGGSAGGMLVGACANMCPDMFKSVVALVPFVDVLNTICDDTLPLTPPEWNEWGNPITSQDAYDYIESYSPYDNVIAQNYPHMFIQAGVTDPRVTYWEPAKWVAKLRDIKTNDSTIVLHTQMGAGHGGASGRYDSIKELAHEYAFIISMYDEKT